MSKQAESIINFEVYEDADNFLGMSQVSLPDVQFLTQTINGAGMSGNIEAVLAGMVDAMTTTMNFRTPTDSAASMLKPRKHNIDLRVAVQNWDTVGVSHSIEADKYVLVLMPKVLKPGTIAPASTSDASGEYATYYYAAYRDGRKLWEIDPYNYICEIDGVDYMADVRKALGR